MNIENEHEHDTILMKYKLQVSRMFSFVAHHTCLWQLPKLSWYYPKETAFEGATYVFDSFEKRLGNDRI